MPEVNWMINGPKRQEDEILIKFQNFIKKEVKISSIFISDLSHKSKTRVRKSIAFFLLFLVASFDSRKFTTPKFAFLLSINTVVRT